MSRRIAALMWVLRFVPDQHNLGVEVLMGSVQQGGVVGLGEAAAFTLASAVDLDPIEPVRALSRAAIGAGLGTDAEQSGDRDAAGSLTRHRDNRGTAARCPGPRLGRS
jgi:hypothetical protein